MSYMTTRRLPSESQRKSVIEDPRDVHTVAFTPNGPDFLIGWFFHTDGKPLWFGECCWRESHLCSATEYGDTRDEVFLRLSAIVLSKGGDR